MARLKKKPGKPDTGWRGKLAHLLRYSFLVFYVFCLAGMVWGARLLSHLPGESDRRREEQMNQRLIEREKQIAAAAAAAAIAAQQQENMAPAAPLPAQTEAEHAAL